MFHSREPKSPALPRNDHCVSSKVQRNCIMSFNCLWSLHAHLKFLNMERAPELSLHLVNKHDQIKGVK